MKPKDLTGAVIDRFFYDTPDKAQADFYELCDADQPLILVFLPNFGHPISRVYLTRYLDSLPHLVSGRLACVVRSNPENIASKLEAPYPFPLICDEAGALYEYFGVQSTSSRMAWSFTAARIFREAKKQGYQMEKGAAQLLPLTLVIGRQGKVLFSHYGESLTDLPEDCDAMERVCSRLNLPAANACEEPEGETILEPVEQPDSDTAPEQDAPNLDDSSQQVLFPGRDVPQEKIADKHSDTDHTQQIDLSGWLASEEEADDEEGDKPHWNKLVDLFAERDKGDEE